MSTKKDAASVDDLTFEQALSRLETIVSTLEADSQDLETALTAYEEGVVLARFCMKRLDAVEMRIQELSLE